MSRGAPIESSRFRILVTEDDVDTRMAVCAILQDEGYDVLEARNGKEALDLLRTTPARPDLILLDVMMPVMGGIEFLAVQRSDEELARTPVIVMTANRAIDLREVHDLSHLGATILPKPVSRESLLAAVRAQMH